jgi:3-deoxy-7-phosphoheptulonate synthase
VFRLTDDLRIAALRPLIPPAILMEELPISETASTTVASMRQQIAASVSGEDHRLVAVVGPCSIHDPGAAVEYAQRLKAKADELAESLCVVMRVYFEKPRTTVGWKGLINDPDLDGSFAINKGLRLARKLLLDLAELGLPAGSEFLDTITPQFIADLISWGGIGARTTESQVHRELASGLSMPVGFKNGTDGNVQIAFDAIRAAQHPHHFLSVTKQGISAIVATSGNDSCHVILRGAVNESNYGPERVTGTAAALREAGMAHRLMIDCSHGNSRKQPQRQIDVVHTVAAQVGEGCDEIFGVMLESHLKEGSQKHSPGEPLVYGQSITDGCLSWEDTAPLLDELAEAAARRRQRS